jgi:hypothetical protein
MLVGAVTHSTTVILVELTTTQTRVGLVWKIPDELQRLKVSAFVRAVTERLIC